LKNKNKTKTSGKAYKYELENTFTISRNARLNDLGRPLETCPHVRRVKPTMRD